SDGTAIFAFSSLSVKPPKPLKLDWIYISSMAQEVGIACEERRRRRGRGGFGAGPSGSVRLASLCSEFSDSLPKWLFRLLRRRPGVGRRNGPSGRLRRLRGFVFPAPH